MTPTQPAATPTERALTAEEEAELRAYLNGDPGSGRDGLGPMHRWYPGGPRGADIVRLLATLDAERAARAPESAAEWPALANDIRRIDGNHDMGAGALAEALTQASWARAARTEPGRDWPSLDELRRMGAAEVNAFFESHGIEWRVVDRAELGLREALADQSVSDGGPIPALNVKRLAEAIADHGDICSRMAIPECADMVAATYAASPDPAQPDRAP